MKNLLKLFSNLPGLPGSIQASNSRSPWMAISRVCKYLQNCDQPIQHVNVERMAADLQTKYREYSRNKKNAFRIAVKAAYDKIVSNIFDCKGAAESQNAKDDDNSQECVMLSSDDEAAQKKMKMSSSYSLNHLVTRHHLKVQNNDSPVHSPATGYIIDRVGDQSVQQNGKDLEAVPNSTSIPTQIQAATPKMKVKKKRKMEESEEGNQGSKRFEAIESTVRFSDLDGIDKVVEEIMDCYNDMFSDSEFDEEVGAEPCQSLLLYGPSGCGKTKIACAIAGESGFSLINVLAPDLVDIGEDNKIKDLFKQAMASQPCFVLIDEIDKIAFRRESSSNVTENKIVSTLKKCFHELSDKDASVYVIGVANEINPVLSSLFESQINIKLPSLSARSEIAKSLCKSKKLDPQFDFQELARMTPAFSGEDLRKLAKRAHRNGRKRMRRNCGSAETKSAEQFITMVDFKAALEVVRPTASEADYDGVPDVKWDDVGAMSDIREKLQNWITDQVQNPDAVERLNLSRQSGALLFGPPGCGKTLVAKALANEACVNFISVKGPELFDKYVGESDRNVRNLFQRAKNCAPCIIFFDEIDSICEKRGTAGESTSGKTNIVQQLLTELDGFNDRKGVYVIGATNRLDRIDPAFLRMNRFSRIIYVGPPMASERFEILRAITKNGTRPPMTEDVDLRKIAYDERCVGLTGADLSYLVSEAADKCRTEEQQTKKQLNVSPMHFVEALANIKPSVSKKDMKYYERTAAEICNSKSGNITEVIRAAMDIDEMDSNTEECRSLPAAPLL